MGGDIEPTVAYKSETNSLEAVDKRRAYDSLSQKFNFAVEKGNMRPQRRKELLAAVKDVADGVMGSAKHEEANFGLDSSFLILKWTRTYEIEVDMCVYYISSETTGADGRMDIHYATCCSKIQNATPEQK